MSGSSIQTGYAKIRVPVRVSARTRRGRPRSPAGHPLVRRRSSAGPARSRRTCGRAPNRRSARSRAAASRGSGRSPGSSGRCRRSGPARAGSAARGSGSGAGRRQRWRATQGHSPRASPPGRRAPGGASGWRRPPGRVASAPGAGVEDGRGVGTETTEQPPRRVTAASSAATSPMGRRRSVPGWAAGHGLAPAAGARSPRGSGHRGTRAAERLPRSLRSRRARPGRPRPVRVAVPVLGGDVVQHAPADRGADVRPEPAAGGRRSRHGRAGAACEHPARAGSPAASCAAGVPRRRRPGWRTPVRAHRIPARASSRRSSRIPSTSWRSTPFPCSSRLSACSPRGSAGSRDSTHERANASSSRYPRTSRRPMTSSVSSDR